MNKKWLGLLMILLVGAALLSACGGPAHEPHAINEETDRCATCNMAVRDDQFATQIVTKDGQSIKFDDIGCMYKWMAENGTDAIGAVFVRDYNSKQWIPREKAFYAYDPSYKTPMAYNVLSFESEAAAQAFIEQQGTGKLMTAEELANHDWKVNREMKEMMKQQHSQGDMHEDQTDADNGHMNPAQNEMHNDNE